MRVRAGTLEERRRRRHVAFDGAVFPASPSCRGGDNEKAAPARH